MNFSEFKERIGAEPRSRDPELLEARKADDACEQAAREAEVFEDKLEGALRFDHDEDAFLAELMAGVAEKDKPTVPRWFAMAASILVVVGVASLSWFQLSKGDDLQRYVEEHWSHDGPALLAKATQTVPAEEVAAVMASLGASASEQVAGRIQYIKFCPTPHGEGAHMILSTPEGLATVIYMPTTTVEKPVLLRVDGMDAQVVNLESGSAAIIGASEAAARELQATLREGVRPVSTDA